MLPVHYKQKENHYFCRFTFGQFFTLLVVEIFTLFFIFYLGARFGRDLLGFEMAKENPSVAQLPGIGSSDPNVIAATNDPEIRALAKDILQATPSPDLKERVAKLLEEEEKQTGTVQAAPEKAEPAIAYQPPTAVIQTVPSTARYSIQVGSYSNVEEAHEKVREWKGRGYDAFMISADIPGKGRWYRIRVGAFTSAEEAKTSLADLVVKEKVEAFVAPNE